MYRMRKDLSFVVKVETDEDALRRSEVGNGEKLTNPLKLLVEGQLEQWTSLIPKTIMQSNNFLEAFIQEKIENYANHKNIKLDEDQLVEISNAVMQHDTILEMINDIVEEEVIETIELTTKYIRMDTTRDDYHRIVEFLSDNTISWEEIEEPIV